jgi:hypothetical protein
MRAQKVAIASVATTLTLTLSQTLPAWADVYKDGSQSCPAGEFVVLHGYGDGTMRYYYPSGVLKTTIQHGSATYGDTVHTGRGSTSWQVSSSDVLYDAGTYSTCEPGYSPAA